MFTIEIENNKVLFSGVLNEQQDLPGMISLLKKIQTQVAGEKIFVDFSKVTRANSAGILVWLKATKELELKLVYEKAPIWLVEQFNFIDEFFEGEVKIKSILARFYNSTIDDSVLFCLEIGKDIPFKEEYSERDFNFKDEAGNMLEPDFDPQLFLNFLSSLGKKIGYVET